jgi:hypothetical protein
LGVSLGVGNGYGVKIANRLLGTGKNRELVFFTPYLHAMLFKILMLKQ